MKYISLILIVLASIFNVNAAGTFDTSNSNLEFSSENLYKTLKSVDVSDDTLCDVNAPFENNIVQQGVFFHGFLDIVEFVEYEELDSDSESGHTNFISTSEKGLVFNNYKVLKHIPISYTKTYMAVPTVSKQVLFQVFII